MPFRFVVILMATALLASSPAFAATNPAVIKMTPQMTTQSLAGRADSDLVEFKNGRQLPVRDIRRLDAISRKLRAPGKPLPAALTAKPVATGGVPLRHRGDLLGALKRADSDTIQLPSGRQLTVGQLRLLKPELEKQLGRPLDSLPVRQIPTGPATKLQRTIDRAGWKGILKQPDSTVLESPNGKRITVGELRQVLSLGQTSQTPAPARNMGGRP